MRRIGEANLCGGIRRRRSIALIVVVRRLLGSQSALPDAVEHQWRDRASVDLRDSRDGHDDGHRHASARPVCGICDGVFLDRSRASAEQRRAHPARCLGHLGGRSGARAWQRVADHASAPAFVRRDVGDAVDDPRSRAHDHAGRTVPIHSGMLNTLVVGNIGGVPGGRGHRGRRVRRRVDRVPPSAVRAACGCDRRGPARRGKRGHQCESSDPRRLHAGGHVRSARRSDDGRPTAKRGFDDRRRRRAHRHRHRRCRRHQSCGRARQSVRDLSARLCSLRRSRQG